MSRGSRNGGKPPHDTSQTGPTTSDDDTLGIPADFLFGLLPSSRRVLNQSHRCSEFTRAGNVTFHQQVLVFSRRLACRATRFSSSSVPPITASRFRRLGSSTLRKRRTVSGVTERLLSSRNPGSTATSSIDRHFLIEQQLRMSNRAASSCRAAPHSADTVSDAPIL